MEKEYTFDTPEGKQTLADLFEGRSQLIVSHFMFGPGWEEGCDGCSFLSDHFDGANLHLAHHDVTLLAVSRAPLEELLPFKKRMGWRFRWVSSNNTDFNHDFHASSSPEAERVLSNFEKIDREEAGGEHHGISVFYKDPLAPWRSAPAFRYCWNRTGNFRGNSLLLGQAPLPDGPFRGRFSMYISTSDGSIPGKNLVKGCSLTRILLTRSIMRYSTNQS